MPQPSRRSGENNGAGGGEEQGFFFGSEQADGARRVEIADHDGERLAVAMLALAQAHHGGFVGGIDGEMESANAFDGEDFAGQSGG